MHLERPKGWRQVAIQLAGGNVLGADRNLYEATRRGGGQLRLAG